MDKYTRNKGGGQVVGDMIFIKNVRDGMGGGTLLHEIPNTVWQGARVGMIVIHHFSQGGWIEHGLYLYNLMLHIVT